MSGKLAVNIIAEAIADHDYSTTNIGRCVCGVKTKDMPAHRSERVVSVLAEHGYSIVPNARTHIEWGARLEYPKWIEVQLCDSYEDALRCAESDKEWASKERREVVKRTVVHGAWTPAADAAEEDQ